MAKRIAPGSPELAAFYSDRTAWRNWGEESIRYRLAQKLALTQPGHAVLDIGGREGEIRKFLPPGIKYQGLDIAPEYAAPDVIIHDITKGLPFPDASFDRVFMIEVLEHTPTAFQTAGEVYRVLKPGGVWVVSVPNPYHFKEIIWNLFGVPDKWGHVYSWTKQTMTRLGEMNGFRRADYAGTYIWPPIRAPWWLLGRSIAYKFVKD